MERGMSLYLAFPLILLEFLSADACTPSISGSSSINLKVGERHTFSCSYSSCSTNRTISWRLNSVTQTTNVNVIYSTSIGSSNVTLYAGNASFTYTPSRPSSTSQNTVTVYCYARTSSDSVRVNIQYGPEVARLNKTGTITLTEYDPTPYIACESTCNPACNFTFLRGGSTRHTGVFFRRFVQRTDTGTYTCKASNRVGSITSSTNFNLNVQYPPNFQLSRVPSSSQVEERTVVTFTFKPREEGNPTSYTFLQCNHTTFSGEFLRSIDYKKTLSQLTFSLQNVSITDGGRYICAVTNNIPFRNGNKIVTASSALQIKTPPIVLMDTKNVTLNGDGNWTLSVDFISLSYTPEIFWYKIVDDRTADYLENIDTKQKGHTMKKDNVSFSIPSYITSVKTKDPGKYLTFIKNSMGNAVVQYLIAVQVPEELSSDSGIALIAVGSVFLVLSALAIGMAAFLFYKTREQST
ncbi:hemicentin-1-like [Saccostrea cucullata]|uniref:hemicentin-1-like n=1 Tax=Saccostrea cuccullata TaxID=36930 RepID=UPI002ED32747